MNFYRRCCQKSENLSGKYDRTSRNLNIRVVSKNSKQNQCWVATAVVWSKTLVHAIKTATCKSDTPACWLLINFALWVLVDALCYTALQCDQQTILQNDSQCFIVWREQSSKKFSLSITIRLRSRFKFTQRD